MEVTVSVKEIKVEETGRNSLQIIITPQTKTPEETEGLKTKIRQISQVRKPAYVRTVICAYEIENV